MDTVERKTIQRDGITFEVKWFYDDDPDLSYLGEYSREWKPGAIDRSEWNDWNENSRELRYFIPGRVDAKDPDAHKWAMRDYKRMEAYCRGDWVCLGCMVTATIDGTEVGSASLWGIESDSDDDYKTSMEEDLINEARAEIPKTAERFKNVLAKIEHTEEVRSDE